jgi:hypothetical protein
LYVEVVRDIVSRDGRLGANQYGSEGGAQSQEA